MPALHAANIPSSLSSAFDLFRYARPSLNNPANMPYIARELATASVDANWLTAYRLCVGLAEGSDSLPPLALQIAAAPLHLAILAEAKFPFRALGLVHLSQQVEQMQAIPSTAAINLLAYTTDARWEKRGMSFVLVWSLKHGLPVSWCGEGVPGRWRWGNRLSIRQLLRTMRMKFARHCTLRNS